MQQQVDEVYMSDEIRRYIVELSRATRQDSRLMLGLSPRASLAVAGMARAAAFWAGAIMWPRRILPRFLPMRPATVCA